MKTKKDQLASIRNNFKFKYLLQNFEDVITEIVMQYNSLVFLEHEAKFPITF